MPYMHLALIAVVLGFFSFSALAQPSIDKVEPPNWWVGMQWDRVQLMVYGENLAGVQAAFNDDRLRVTGVHTLESSSYAFVDVYVPADLSPGSYTLSLTTAAGSTTHDWAIETRAPSEGRHQGFSMDDVVYLLTPDRFANGNLDNDAVDGLMEGVDRSNPGMRHGGDLDGLIGKLDYLADLGVTALWLNPVLENNGRYSYHGYAATDLYQIDARFGSNADYKRFVEEAQARGLKVIFDHVNNHIGINHPWMQDLPAASWIHGTRDDKLPRSHYKLATTDPYADPYTAERMRSFWFVDSMPDLDQSDPFLATYRIQNTLWWLEYTGLDGIREDTYPYVDQDFLAHWAEVIFREYPNMNIVGEIWEGVPSYLAMWQKDSRLPRNYQTNLPSVMDFALTDAFRAYLRGEGKLADIYTVLAQDFLYTDPTNLVTFLDNHDMTRGMYETNGDPTRLRQVLAMLLTTRRIPQLLYGTEIGMIGGESHVELRADMPGGWPDDDRSVFTAEGRTDAENALFDFTRQLLHLRRDHVALRRGELVHYPTHYDRDTYKYLRIHEDETILVVVNGHDYERQVDLSEMAWRFPDQLEARNLLTGEAITIDVAAGFPIGAYGVHILRLEP